MNRIKNILQQTNNKFLNLFCVDAVKRNGSVGPYFVASRAKNREELKITTRKNTPDGVAIFGVYGENKDKVVLVKQFRYSIDDYIYEFPAGLVEPNEDMKEAAIREIYEETGLTLNPLDVPDFYNKPYFTSIGMTDESCGTVYGYLTGNPTNIHQEASEDIQVIIADRAECKRILEEENVAIMCAYMLMHFINSDDEPFSFLK